MGAPLADYSYSYDIDGRKTQETRIADGHPIHYTSYGYDDLGRLAYVTFPSGDTRNYFYDRDSNRTQAIDNGMLSSSYSYDPQATPGVDQLSSQTGPARTFGYDTDGNMIGRGADTISWDGWGRMSGGTFAGTTVSYGFDPTGFRRSRTSAGATTRYLLG